MTMTAGFYKYESKRLLYGPNSVLCPEYQLFKEAKNDYAYPLDGWYWFYTQEEAYGFFGIEEDAHQYALQDRPPLIDERSKYDILYMSLLISNVYQSFLVRIGQSMGNAPIVAMATLIDALREARTRAPIIPAIRAALQQVLLTGEFTPEELAELAALLEAAGLADTYSLTA